MTEAYYLENRERVLEQQKQYKVELYVGKPRKFNTGEHVRHPRYGPGVILGEWGSWHSCRECNREIPAYASKGDKTVCAHCQHEGNVQHVSGDGVFDVLFVRGRRSINGHWLRKDLKSKVTVVTKQRRLLTA